MKYSMRKIPIRITFCGGIHTTTGSNFLVDAPDKAILVDCGFFQGENIGEHRNRDAFSYDPTEVSVLFVTHAHLDHVGRIPMLVRSGFSGSIYSTKATKEIAELILIDSLRVLTKEAEQSGEDPMYTQDDVKKAMRIWKTVDYNETVSVGEYLSVSFRDAGHILGSAMVVIECNGKKLLFTGDLGNSPAPLLRDTEYVDDIACIVTESVYGDRNHEDRNERRELLKSAIIDTIGRGGVLMIPAFSIERTQELLFEINHLAENKLIPEVPVFLDSPLAIKVTDIYKRHEYLYNKRATDIIHGGDDIFAFPFLRFTMTRSESIAINNIDGPKIILAGSGMSNGGRILHHEKRYLSDRKNTLLIVGFQAAGTLGRRIQDGAKKVEINGDIVPIRAEIRNIRGYSAHKDSDGILDFIEKATEKGELKKVFVVLGEPKSSLFLAQKIRDYLDIDASTPLEGECVELLF